MRYAARVKADPSRSLVFDRKAENETHFLSTTEAAASDFTGLHKIVLLLFGATFAVMIWGVSLGGWWMAEMSGLFLFAGIGIGLVGRLGEKGLVEAFVGGARDLLGVALIIGLARGIVVVMDAGHITDTILHWAEGTVAGLNRVVFINVMYWIQVSLSFFVPSTSGLAVLSMPILAPVGDFRRGIAQPGRDSVPVGRRRGQSGHADLRRCHGRPRHRAGALRTLAALRLAGAAWALPSSSWPPSASASSCKEPRHDPYLRRPFRGGQAAPRSGPQARRRHGAADPRQLRRTAVR
jgi:hypothetical protein